MRVSDRIRLAIKEDIRTGMLPPGHPVDEKELAARYGVSRTPIREALLQLEVQGLLASQPRGGMTVVRMDLQELLAIWELMAEMEGVCARLACQRMSPAEREELATVHHRAAAIVDADDAKAWSEANHAFHEVLYRGCRNPYLRQELLQLRARTGAYLQHAFGAVGRIRASHEQHGDLLAAILAEDPERAYRMMMQHISLAQGARGLADFLISMPRSMVRS